MAKLSLTRLVAAVGGLTLSLTAGAGVASADPDLGSAVNTTCTYDQVLAALNAQDPILASDPEMQAGLQQFVAGSPSQRRQIAQGIVSNPDTQPYVGTLLQTFATCNNF
jgi:hemophore-related protein